MKAGLSIKGGVVRTLTAVGALGVIGDISSVHAATTTPRTDDMSQTERDIGGLGGVAGLASLSPALAPVAAPMALGFGGASVAIDYRRKRDEELEKTRQYMDPANRSYIGDSVITKTKPKLPMSFTGRL